MNIPTYVDSLTKDQLKIMLELGNKKLKEIQDTSKDVWEVYDGHMMLKEFKFEDYPAMIEYLSKVAKEEWKEFEGRYTKDLEFSIVKSQVSLDKYIELFGEDKVTQKLLRGSISSKLEGFC